MSSLVLIISVCIILMFDFLVYGIYALSTHRRDDFFFVVSVIIVFIFMAVLILVNNPELVTKFLVDFMSELFDLQ